MLIENWIFYLKLTFIESQLQTSKHKIFINRGNQKYQNQRNKKKQNKPLQTSKIK